MNADLMIENMLQRTSFDASSYDANLPSPHSSPPPQSPPPLRRLPQAHSRALFVPREQSN